MNYFVFNKEKDYRRGYFENCIPGKSGVYLKEGEDRGIFFSRVLDSLDASTVWGRVIMDITGQSETSVQITYYTADADEIFLEGRYRKIQEIIQDSDISAEKKQEAFKRFQRKHTLYPADQLLYDLKGRYLWFCIQFYGIVQEETGIGNIQIFFPKENWISYLPEFYQRDMGQGDFLERFLAVFQSEDEEIEKAIRTSARAMDADLTPRMFMEWLASWIHIEEIYIWRDDQLRTLLRDAKKWFSRRGTAGSLVYLLELYTGDDVYYLEPNEQEGRKISSLVINPKDPLSQQELRTVRKLIDLNRPAHVEVELIILKHNIRLGDYNYLGVNSNIGHYAQAVLDGGFRLSMIELTNET